LKEGPETISFISRRKYFFSRLAIEKRVWSQNCRKSALHNRIFVERPEVVPRPRSQSHLHLDSQNIYQIRIITNKC